MGKLQEVAKKAAVKVGDRDKDGDVDRDDARKVARVWEERFPLGILLAVFIAGAFLGGYLRGLFA